MLLFLVHKIFTFYINGVLNCKCPAPGPKVQARMFVFLIYAASISLYFNVFYAAAKRAHFIKNKHAGF